MKKLLKTIKKIFFLLLIALTVIFSATILSVYFFGDQIKNRIISNLNTQINTEIKVNEIDLDPWEFFPNLSLKFNNVEVSESLEFSNQNLLSCDKLYIILNPLKLLKKDYTVNSLALVNGQLNIKIDQKGNINYLIFKPNEMNASQKSYFSIQNLYLKNIDFTYKDLQNAQYVEAKATDFSCALSLKNDQYTVDYDGEIQNHFIEFNRVKYLENKELNVKGKLLYHNIDKMVNFQKSEWWVQNSEFLIDGYYNMGEGGKIELNVEGKNTSIQNLVSLLPTSTSLLVEKYQSSGDVYFDLKLSGKLNSVDVPALSVHFGCKNTTITHPKTLKKITDANFEGFFISNSMSDYNSAELNLSNVNGVFNGNALSGNFSIQNLNDPFLKFDLKTDLNLIDLYELFPNEMISDISGALAVDISFEGRIKDLESKSTIHKVNSDGLIQFQNVEFRLRSLNSAVSEINGNLLFGNKYIEVDLLSGLIGNSSFLINGSINNLFGFVFTDTKRLNITANLVSDKLDLNELLSITAVSNQESNNNENSYFLNLPPELALDIDCDIKELNFKRFSGRGVKGKIKVLDQLAMLEHVQFNEAGGSVFLEGFVDTKGQTIEVLTHFETKNVNIDSLFYIFEDFNQDFLVHSHLSGKMTSTVSADMSFTKNLILIPQSLVADMNIAIKGGELRNFEPMQLLAPYLPNDNLKHLIFADLSNEIHVENQTIFLPPMKINSNVTNITIGGRHTFDQHINYKIIAPLINRNVVDKDQAFGAIEETDSAIPRIHLLLTGTTSDYEIKLDKEGTKNQVVSDIKREVKELKDAFKMKREKKEKTLTLEEDEYFDWDN